MLNDPQPGDRERRPHPLEQLPDAGKPQPQDQPPERGTQRVMLHIPVARPRLTYALIAVNAFIFVLVYYILSDEQTADVYRWGVNNQRLVLSFGEYHRLLSAMFLHSLATPAHIVFNMFALYYIGITVERFFGTLRFALIYFLGGLWGSILSVFLNGPDVTSVGASGAVFALVGAEMVFLYFHRKLLGAVAQTRLRSLIIIAGMNFAVGIASAFSTNGPGIDNWGHIGGLAGGVALAWFISPVFILRRHPERPGAFTTEDINPLTERVQVLIVYVSALIGALILAQLIIG